MSLVKRLIKFLTPLMLQWGYQRKNHCFYVISNDLAFCIEVDSPGALVYVTYYIIPLYMPTEFRHYTYGNRLTGLPPLARNASEESINAWCTSLCNIIERTVFPFFSRVSSPEKLVNFAAKSRLLVSEHLFCPDEELLRLRVFTFLYLQNMKELRGAIGKIHSILERKTLGSSAVRENFLKELDTIESLLTQPFDTIRSYCEGNITNSIAACFK